MIFLWNNKRGETPQGRYGSQGGSCGQFLGVGGLPQEIVENEVL